MEEKKIELAIKVFKTEELSNTDAQLRKCAIKAARKAYAPYSKFRVGAVVLLTDDTYVIGNNQENAAYPSGLCAERVALFTAAANFPDTGVIALAIVALKGGVIQPAVSPCGACRQVMLESEQRYGRDIRVLLCGCDETIIIPSAKDLLPLCFGKKNL
jgi:cytidine deaminase